MNFDEIDIRGYSQGGGIVTARDSLHSCFFIAISSVTTFRVILITFIVTCKKAVG